MFKFGRAPGLETEHLFYVALERFPTCILYNLVFRPTHSTIIVVFTSCLAHENMKYDYRIESLLSEAS